MCGHTAPVTAVAINANGRTAASVDATGTAMVWRAAELMPLASVPEAAHSTSSQHSGRGAQPSTDEPSQHGSGEQQLPGRAVVWLPAPDAAVGIAPSGGVSTHAKGAEGHSELLLLADGERLLVWSVPTKAEVGRAVKPAEAASVPMPEGCVGIRKLMVLAGSTGSTDRGARSAIVFGHAQMAADSEVVYTWHLTLTDLSPGYVVDITLVDELQLADISRHSDVNGAAASISPQGAVSGFATLISHDSVQLAMADPAAGVISLYSLRKEAVPGSQHGVPTDTSDVQQTQLVGTADMRGAGDKLSQPAQQARTAGRGSTSVSVLDVALSASARHLAAVGTQGARR